MELTLAERLLLLALDDESGRDATSSGVDAGLAGALLVELIQSGHLHDAGGELVPIDGGAADPLLDAAHEAISASHKRRDAKGWVGRLQKDLRPIKERVARSLVERGVLDEGRRKLLGLLPSPRFPERDAKPERALRERLAAVLMGEREPDEDDVLLVRSSPR